MCFWLLLAWLGVLPFRLLCGAGEWKLWDGNGCVVDRHVCGDLADTNEVHYEWYCLFGVRVVLKVPL